MKIGCIGQGFVGKNIADNFEQRGYAVVRYALEEPYRQNASLMQTCDVIFVAVPTPSTPEGFDVSIVTSVLALAKEGSIIVIKSTLLPGTTRALQDAHPQKVVLFSPEFLCEKTAAYDVAHPFMNIIGFAYDSAGHRKAAESVKALLPKAEHNFIVSAQAAELFKYAHNLNGYFRVMLSNLLYNVAMKEDIDWSDVKIMMDNDIMMSPYYNAPVHKGGRGAGGNCFIKDMAAFRHFYTHTRSDDALGLEVLQALEKMNLALLKQSNKNQDIVRNVYGV